MISPSDSRLPWVRADVAHRTWGHELVTWPLENWAAGGQPPGGPRIV
jgi:hypothetical protein